MYFSSTRFFSCLVETLEEKWTVEQPIRGVLSACGLPVTPLENSSDKLTRTYLLAEGYWTFYEVDTSFVSSVWVQNRADCCGWCNFRQAFGLNVQEF